MKQAFRNSASGMRGKVECELSLGGWPGRALWKRRAAQ